MAGGPVRIEKDSMGELAVPAGALWGAQTQRAIENFPLSGIRFPRRFLAALGLVKRACAEANLQLGLLDPRLAEAILAAGAEMIAGELDRHFPLDVFQTGSGTSTNMNANEVLANRAIQLLGGEVGSRRPVHPNDHVNLSQSSNDVFPTAVHLAAILAIEEDLLPGLDELRLELAARAAEFDGIVKIGRTHLQDATPIRLGQEFAGYAAQAAAGAERARQAAGGLRPVALGGTAVGTGVNRLPAFRELALERLSQAAGTALAPAASPFEANAARDGCVAASGLLRTVAVSLSKIAGDVRWLGSGPRAGLGELRLPAVQPGSSIMPGKVNPVIPEAVLQACWQVIANDVAVTLGGLDGRFELNLAQPLIARNLLESIGLLAAATRVFARRCLRDLAADEEQCRRSVERSLALATALVPLLGYDRAAEIARRAGETGRTIREIVREEALIEPGELDRVLDARRLTEPGMAGGGT